jgi:hypothetical protein
MTLLFVIGVVLIVALLGSLPIWPHSRGWGYCPLGVAMVPLVILVLLFTGHMHAH